MYVLVNNDRVVLGPRTWNKNMFEYTLKDDYGILYSLPTSKQDSVKIQINDSLKICFVTNVKPEINEKIYTYSAPIFNTAGDVVIAQYGAVPKAIEQVKAELKAVVAAARWEKENGGVNVGGNIILTDAISQSKVSGALALINLNPSATIDWKGANGWMTLTAPQVAAIGLAVGNHVQACFTKEKQLNNAIDSCTTLNELDNLDLTF